MTEKELKEVLEMYEKCSKGNNTPGLMLTPFGWVSKNSPSKVLKKVEKWLKKNAPTIQSKT